MPKVVPIKYSGCVCATWRKWSTRLPTTWAQELESTPPAESTNTRAYCSLPRLRAPMIPIKVVVMACTAWLWTRMVMALTARLQMVGWAACFVAALIACSSA